MESAADVHTTTEQIVAIERAALDRWGNGDPGGFLDLYGPSVSYFDPTTALRLDGHQTMADYYAPWTGKIHIARYEMVNPEVVVDGNMAVLTYNLVNYMRDAQGHEVVGTRWNSTTVFRNDGGAWTSIHAHWSYTRHPALQNLTAAASEGVEA